MDPRGANVLPTGATGGIGQALAVALDVSLRAPIVMAKLAGERMADRGRGHLVLVSSLSGKAASGHASLSAAVQRRAGGQKISQGLATGQRDKR